MKVLDADISPLISRRYGRAKRGKGSTLDRRNLLSFLYLDADIVQFVNFNDVRRRGRDITSATLEEIPDQVASHRFVRP
jgi:hypothetical protein